MSILLLLGLGGIMAGIGEETYKLHLKAKRRRERRRMDHHMFIGR